VPLWDRSLGPLPVDADPHLSATLSGSKRKREPKVRADLGAYKTPTKPRGEERPLRTRSTSKVVASDVSESDSADRGGLRSGRDIEVVKAEREQQTELHLELIRAAEEKGVYKGQGSWHKLWEEACATIALQVASSRRAKTQQTPSPKRRVVACAKTGKEEVSMDRCVHKQSSASSASNS
jgi:hypothetical protein